MACLCWRARLAACAAGKRPRITARIVRLPLRYEDPHVGDVYLPWGFDNFA